MNATGVNTVDCHCDVTKGSFPSAASSRRKIDLDDASLPEIPLRHLPSFGGVMAPLDGQFRVRLIPNQVQSDWETVDREGGNTIWSWQIA